MKRIIPALVFCGMLALLSASGCGGDPALTLEKSAITLKPGDKEEVKAKTGKIDKLDPAPDPKTKLSPVVAPEKLTITADKEAPEGDTTIKVKGTTGTAELKVTVKK